MEPYMVAFKHMRGLRNSDNTQSEVFYAEIDDHPGLSVTVRFIERIMSIYNFNKQDCIQINLVAFNGSKFDHIFILKHLIARFNTF